MRRSCRNGWPRCRTLASCWHLAGYWREARSWLEEGLARAGNAPSQLRVPAIEALGSILSALGESDRAESLLREALTCSREVGDVRTTIHALNSLGGLAIRRADYDLALSLQGEAYVLSQEIGDRRWSGTLLKILANASRFAGKMALARRQLDEALAIHRESGNEEGIAITLNQWQAYALWALGALATRKGDNDEALFCLHQSLTMARAMGDSFLVLGLLEDVAVLMGAWVLSPDLLLGPAGRPRARSDQQEVAHLLRGA